MKLLPRLILSALLFTGCLSQEKRPLGSDLSIRWGVVDNFLERGFSTELVLFNRGAEALPASGWTLYFNFGRMPFPDSFPPELKLTHINGDFFKLEPTTAFAPLLPGDSLRIGFEAPNWAIKEGEAPAGFYIVFTDAEGLASAPEAVADVQVAPFVSPRQVNRSASDRWPVATPALRYHENRAISMQAEEQVGLVVPTPVGLMKGQGTLDLGQTLEIRHAGTLAGEAAYLADALAELLGARPAVVESTAGGPQAILLKIGPVRVGAEVRQSGAEAYRLTVAPEQGVEIVGTDAAGVFYGIQSLRALVPVAAYRETQERLTVPALVIEDAPRFGYRGMLLDVGRNFQTKRAVLKLLDVMAFYKLNKFHFHLTDDEGWRLAIAGLPELTEVGGRRGHTLDERDHLVPSYGSGPNPASPTGSGFYTRADFIEILQYARDRHIEVIPEIDVPGHARSAIKAMETRSERLAAQGGSEAVESYLLSEAADPSTYMSVQMWKDNVINVCQPSTYRFLQAVVDDLVAMYREAGAPFTTIHTGGDEVPGGVWEQSPACAALIAETPDLEGTADLPGYFLRRISDMLAEHGLVTAGWEEIALKEMLHGGDAAKEPSPDFVGRNFRPYVWNSVWGWGSEDLGYKLANAGYPVVLSYVANLYFDLAYEKDPAEPGYYWGGFVDTRKPYELVPLDLFKNAALDLMGNPLDEAAYADRTRLTAAGRRNVLGIQGQLWGENAKGQEMMEYLAFPKLLGLAERAWAQEPTWAMVENREARAAGLAMAWNGFANTLGRRDLPRLDYLFGGVRYRIPPPGAIIKDGMLLANIAFPGLTIRYTLDGTEPTTASPLYEGPVPVKGVVNVRAFDTLGRGGRSLTAGPLGQ